ncbi:MAG: nucleotidyltransferase domain-containing protein [Candidatus Thorarchaeota archaeon]
MTKNLVEGHFIVTVDGLVFEIKGVIHPRNRVIAYLRYVPTSDSDTMYRKVYALDEREEYLQSNYPSYLWFSEPHGRVVQSVPNDMIKSMLDPVDCLTNLRNCTSNISDLEQASVNLARKLVESTGVEWSDIGLTGSQLVGVAGKDSDIDLVVFGADACRKFYSNLRRNIASIIGVEPYAGSMLDKHVSFRWGAHENLKSILRKIERVKVLQGLFEGFHFFVRLVKTPDDLDYVYGDISYQVRGQQLVTGKVVDDNDSIFTPCEYLIECDELPNLRKLVSYRGRFTEQISKDMSFEALGRLEMVTNHKKSEQYMQLVLGELPTDYLIPKK